MLALPICVCFIRLDKEQLGECCAVFIKAVKTVTKSPEIQLEGDADKKNN